MVKDPPKENCPEITDEQRRRMEENRKRALELRAARHAKMFRIT